MAGDKPIAFVVAGWAGEGVTGYPAEDNANLIAAANPAAITELLDRLEAAEKSDAESLAMYRKARDERDTLRAKVAEMERQEPVAEWLPLDSGEDTRRD